MPGTGHRPLTGQANRGAGHSKPSSAIFCYPEKVFWFVREYLTDLKEKSPVILNFMY
jgi:hypothetical protein